MSHHQLLGYRNTRMLMPTTRFVASPTSDVKTRLSKESEDLKSDVVNLEKKLHYLETTYKNSREHLDAVFKNGGR